MTTNININVGQVQLTDLAARQQQAARKKKQELESQKVLEKKARQEKNKISAQKGRDERRRSEPFTTFERPTIDDEPIAPKSMPYYWLATREWWFDDYTFNSPPRAGATLEDVAKVSVVTVRGKSNDTSYKTIGDGLYSVYDLLNETTSGFTFYGIPYLPPLTPIPSDPFVCRMTEPRKAFGGGAAGDQTNPSLYTDLNRYQLPIFEGGSISFYKPFYNYYLETVDTSNVSIATQPKPLSGKGKIRTAKSSNLGKTFEANNSTLFDVGHIYLASRWETGPVTIKPIGTTRFVHVFVEFGVDRNGFYDLTSSGASSFQVDDLVYWQNISLYLLEPQIYRYGTIIEIERGMFTYDTDIDPGFNEPETITGLRIVIELSDNLTLGVNTFSRLNDSTLLTTFSSVEQALGDRNNTIWITNIGTGGGYLNEWVTEMIDGTTIPPPQLKAAFIGDSFLFEMEMDCSKDGKAYFYQSAYKRKDDPIWRRQENYYDGDFVLQRPGNLFYYGTDFVDRSLVIRFFELDCAKNKITQSSDVEVSFLDPDDATATLVSAMPSWFPSKKYREAGYVRDTLNLNKKENIASRFYTVNQPGGVRYFIKYWPIDQSLPIEQVVQMLNEEADAEEIEITDSRSKEELNKEIDIAERDGPSRWGYSFAAGTLVSY